MNKIVCGADVCKDSIVCCFLSQIPDDIPKYFKAHSKKFPKIKSTMKGLEKFLSFHPTHLVLEPTGTNYAWIFAEIATQNGIKVLWAPNHKCKAFRDAYDLPSKNDAADALALCLTGLTYSETSKLWINFSHRDGLSNLRNLVLQHESINRMKSPVSNRIRQQLAREFPEAALLKTKKSVDGNIPLWAWLAGIDRNLTRKNSTYDKLWDKSLAKYLGIEISDFTRHLAQILSDYETEQQRIEAELLKELKKPQFKDYQKILFRFGLNLKLQAWIVAMIYPLDKFFDDDGMKKARSRFKQRLGMGRVEHSSGDKKGSKSGGSAIARKMLYWHVYHLCTQKQPKSWTKNMDLVNSYYRHLLDRWNNDPKAIAARERKLAIKKANDSLQRQLKDVLDTEALRKLKQAVTANIESDFDLGQATDPDQSRWKKLVITRTAAKMCEYIWQALLDELYPKT